VRAVTASPARISALWFGINAVWGAILGVFLQSRVEELIPGDDVRAYAAIAAGGALTAAVVQVAAGFWSDRHVVARGSRLAFYTSGLALAALALAGFFAAPTFGWLVVAFGALQVGMNVAGGPYQAAIPDALGPERSGRASGWMSASSSAGSVAGLLIAATLHGWAAAAALLAALLVPAAIALAHVRALPPAVPRAAALRITAPMLTILVSRGAINVGFYTLLGFLFFFVRETLHVAGARTTTGILFLAFTLAGVAGAALAGRAADRYDKRVVIGCAAIAIAIAVGAFAAAPNLPVALVAAIASGCAWGAFFTADWAIAYAVLPRGAMAAAMGIWNLAAAIPQIVAPAITAPLVTALDARSAGLGPRAALALVALEFVLGTLILWRLPRAALQPAGTDDPAIRKPTASPQREDRA
jgi:MFS family permease